MIGEGHFARSVPVDGEQEDCWERFPCGSLQHAPDPHKEAARRKKGTMMDNGNTFWVIEMQGVQSGEIEDRRVFNDPAKLGDFVRVNANDARRFRIAIADEANLVELRIGEAFTGD